MVFRDDMDGPTKILGVGGNHESQVTELDYLDWPETPEQLPVFLKPPSVVVEHDREVSLPLDVEVVPEVELAIVLGERCKDVRPDSVDEVDYGFTICNDLTITGLATSPSPLLNKLFDDSAPLGPDVVGIEEVPDDANMETRINGEVVQRGRRDGYVLDESELIGFFSRRLTLHPGDVIAMGTVSGGRPVCSGDDISLHIEGIGELRNSVV